MSLWDLDYPGFWLPFIGKSRRAITLQSHHKTWDFQLEFTLHSRHFLLPSLCWEDSWLEEKWEEASLGHSFQAFCYCVSGWLTWHCRLFTRIRFYDLKNNCAGLNFNSNIFCKSIKVSPSSPLCFCHNNWDLDACWTAWLDVLRDSLRVSVKKEKRAVMKDWRLKREWSLCTFTLIFHSGCLFSRQRERERTVLGTVFSFPLDWSYWIVSLNLFERSWLFVRQEERRQNIWNVYLILKHERRTF